MIFTQNHSTLQRTTGARFCRTELLRTPFERILSILLRLLVRQFTRSICTHQAHHMYQQKIQYQLFSPISAYSQTTKEILHKNVFYHSDIIFFENSRKSYVSEKKVRPNPTHTALYGGVPNQTSWEQVLEKKRNPLRERGKIKIQTFCAPNITYLRSIPSKFLCSWQMKK